MSEPDAIITQDLRRVFDPRRGSGGTPTVALAGLTLAIAPGEVHGLLGPNGAGKSTLMRLLSTVLLPTSGRAAIQGFDVVRDTREVRRRIGVVFGGERGLYPRLSGRQNLSYWAALCRLDGRAARARVAQLLDQFDLGDRADDRVETYSTGMRQRLHLARGLVGSPSVLLLDEPTNGLDPVAAGRLRQTIRDIAAGGRTVLMATHDMMEAEAVCDRVSLVNRGRLLATEHPRSLALRVLGSERVEVDGADERQLAAVRSLAEVAAVTNVRAGTARITVSCPEGVAAVLRCLLDAGLTSVRAVPPSLEEVYLTLIGDAPRDDAARGDGVRGDAVRADDLAPVS